MRELQGWLTRTRTRTRTRTLTLTLTLTRPARLARRRRLLRPPRPKRRRARPAGTMSSRTPSMTLARHVPPLPLGLYDCRARRCIACTGCAPETHAESTGSVYTGATERTFCSVDPYIYDFIMNSLVLREKTADSRTRALVGALWRRKPESRGGRCVASRRGACGA